MVNKKNIKGQHQDPVVLTVVNTSYNETMGDVVHIVRLNWNGDPRDDQIQVTFTYNPFSFGNWVKEASSQRLFSFSFKSDRTCSFLNILYANKCMVFGFEGTTFPPNVSEFLLDQQNSFYGMNMVGDYIRDTLSHKYGLAFGSNINYLTNAEVSQKISSDQQLRECELVNKLHARNSKWGTAVLGEDAVKYVVFVTYFVYKMMM